MSVSKWRYTEECNGRPCPGDCDHCSFEPTDLISRADAIEAVRKELVCDGRHETHDKTCRFIADVLLSALPSAEAVQGWTPVSERLPKEGQGVIVTVDDNVYKIRVGSCIYSNGRFHSLYNDLTVTAWMPLPTPYKGGDDE